MRKVAILMLTLMFAACLILPVSAATGVSSMNASAVVASDGGCQMSITATIRLVHPVEKLNFPIPADARSVTLNGSRVSASKGDGVRNVSLSRVVRNVVGEVTFNIQYSLYDVIQEKEGGILEMHLPVLSGFTYPIEKMEFSVTMPGNVETLPGFVSGYHEARIEEDLSYEVDGAIITGNSLRAMKDHETLTMTMTVNDTMFPRTITRTHEYGWAVTGMQICLAVAAVLWIIGMWNPPGFARTQPEPPQGYDAGSLAAIMAGGGLDLTMMVFTWAQLGYVLIESKGKRVILHKRMDMGNERSETEVRWFRKLFNKRSRVNTSELRYAQLCRAAAKKPEGTEELMRRFNLDPRIFRGVAALGGLFGGLAIAVAMANGAALQGLLMVLLGAGGAFSGWHIQKFGQGLFMQNQRQLTQSLTLCGVWLVLGLLCGAADVALMMSALLLAAGILLAWGGRRTSMGRLIQMQSRGYVRYLQRVKKKELQRLLRNDPEYFFRVAPYALALGREMLLAKKMGEMRLERCWYLTTGMDGHMTALQWATLMRRTADAMNDRANRLPMEKLIQVISSMIRK